jgi:hypothetical protein
MTVGRVARRALPTLVLFLGGCLGEPILLGRTREPAAGHADAVTGTIVDRSLDGTTVDPHLPDTCDQDVDGWESFACGGDDCDDRAADVNPDVLENEDWTVDVLAEDGSLPALALDRRGVPHAAYRQGSGSEASIVYATNIIGTWLPETIATVGETSHPPALAIAPSGRAHLCWTSFEQGVTRLGYATNASGAWTTAVQEWYGGAPTRCAIVVDARGVIHVAYQDPILDVLRYMSTMLGRWQTEVVDDDIGAGAFPTLLLDGTYVTRIGYQDSNNDLHYAVRTGNVWQSEVVESGFGSESVFAAGFTLDEQGAAHVSYRSAVEPRLRYATNATGVWVYETIEVPGYSARASAVGMDGDSFAHIVFSHDDRRDLPNDLLFATRAGGAWSHQTIDEEGRTGWGPTLVVGSTLLHVTYFRFAAGGQRDVLYATRSVPDGIDADCDGEL